MSGQIPTMWPDVEAWFIGWVTAAKVVAADSALTGVLVRNQKPAAKKADGTANPDGTPPYKHVVVAADPGQLITPITRYVRVRVQGWVVTAQGSSDLKKAFNLTNVVAYIAQQAPRDGNPIVSVEVDSGPSRVKDETTGLEYSFATLLLEVRAL